MLRLSEEQMAILSCYSGTKEEVMTELQKAIRFIEDMELRELSEDLLMKANRLKNYEFEEITNNEIVEEQ